VDGGYAEYVVADHRFCFAMPTANSAAELAPWLCAGLIGYPRTARRGRGAAARNLRLWRSGAYRCEIARFQGQDVFAFHEARRLGGAGLCPHARRRLAGSSEDAPPDVLAAAIIFAPAGLCATRLARRCEGRKRGMRGYSHE
jgi:propanol-preferring alcohol dehydrogenase